MTSDGTVETLRSRVKLSNGIGFSPDGQFIYHVDSLARTIARHSYSASEFDTTEPWEILLHFAEADGLPVGLTVDDEGAVWVTMWGGGSVRRYSSSGTPLHVVRVNATQTSCMGFVGASMSILAITSAQEGLSLFSDESGAIFTAAVDARGLPNIGGPGTRLLPIGFCRRTSVRSNPFDLLGSLASAARDSAHGIAHAVDDGWLVR